MNRPKRIKELLRRYLSKELSETDSSELSDLIENINEPNALNEIFLEQWNLSSQNESLDDLNWSDIISAQNKNKPLVSKRKRIRRLKPYLQWSVAASILFVLFWIVGNLGVDDDYTIYTSGNGETREIVLDDGTEVVLNANSTLEWKNSWKVDQERYIELDGEAYFKVKKIESVKHLDSFKNERRMPFFVKSSNVVVSVLGTSFNVENRRGEIKVFLEEGSIKLEVDKRKDVLNKEDVLTSSQDDIRAEPITLVPGEFIKYSKESQELVQLKNGKSKAITEWKNGVLIFEDVTLKEMVMKIEDIYGKEIKIENKDLLNKKVNFGLPYGNWDVVKRLMEVTLGIEISSKGENEVILKDKN